MKKVEMGRAFAALGRSLCLPPQIHRQIPRGVFDLWGRFGYNLGLRILR